MLTPLKDHVIIELSCGQGHSLAVTSEGKTFSWGQNEQNQLGVEGIDFAERPIEIKGLRGVNIKAVSCGYEHSLALSQEGDLYSWGQGEGGLLGQKDYERRSVPTKIEFFNKLKVDKAICGGLHNLAIDLKGRLYSWGRAEGGQLGLSKEELEAIKNIDEGISIPRLIISDKFITDIAAGVAHSIACTKEGQVCGWGWGNYGQLGLGFTGENFETGKGNQEST